MRQAEHKETMSQPERCRTMSLIYLLCYLVWFQIVQPDLIFAKKSENAQSNGPNTVPKLSLGQQMQFLQNKITKELAAESDNISHKALDERIEDDLFFYEQGVDKVNGNASIPLHHLYISNNASLLAAVKTAGLLSAAATKDLSARLNLSRELLDVLPETKSIPRAQFNCPFLVGHHCNPADKYRTADGSCNNLQNTIWGRAGTPQIRFLSPVYDDGFSSPRTIALSGKPLPSARLVSTSVHQPDSNNTFHRNVSHMVMQWGQFIDHDITSTPIETGHENSDISCCIKNASEEIRQRSIKRLACFPIPIPENDRHFKSKCLNFVRSLPTPNANCTFGYREQLNKLSSFIDGGTVYGNSIKEQSQLRSHVNGQMKESFPNLLPKDSEDSCTSTPTNYCFRAGDSRVNEQMGLVSIHTLFFRDHNRIARHLSNMTLWSDEKIFQETKRIVTAIIQHINYNEFLPTILNTTILNSFDLVSPSSGFHDVYNSMVDPSIRNAFSTAAFRFGHSMVRSFFTKLSPNYNTSFGPPTLLKTMFFNTSEIFADKTKSVGAFFRGLLKDKAQNCDRFISTQLTDHLFEDNSGHSFDLAAFNIQRGRDHGLPPYNRWREFCGLSKVTHFGIGSGGLVDHNNSSANQIQSVYEYPDDIDLFTGGMSENPIEDGVVGPTFACIIARQFKMLKTGDRFWYERDNSTVGFSINQLDQIRKMTLSKLICLNTDISQIQRNAFLVPGPNNPLVSCDSLPNMDLNVWSS